MPRIIERGSFTLKERIQWLERDADELEVTLHREMSDLRTDMSRIESKQDRILTLLISLLCAVLAAMVTVVATAVLH